MVMVWSALRSQPVPTSFPFKAPKMASANRVMTIENLSAVKLPSTSI